MTESCLQNTGILGSGIIDAHDDEKLKMLLNQYTGNEYVHK